MARIALHNKNGMTLIEVMISLLILMVVALAVMQTALVGMRVNLQNAMRDEAVNVADLRMEELRSKVTGTTFDGSTLTLSANDASGGDLTVINSYAEPVISRTFRGASVNYAPTRTVSSINADTKQVTLSVSWPFPANTYTHTITTIMRRQ
jgi:type II secretory pathway pseudopilin PulG